MLKPLDLLARDHPCTFGKLETKSKILVNHKDHPCTLLKNLRGLKHYKCTMEFGRLLTRSIEFNIRPFRKILFILLFDPLGTKHIILTCWHI
ncbi:hypothetical protein HanIR_Chr04g0162741 [Helianthus annuus]|nr:hypothetical protein HanIR_Chr04g0162741 [Helianthus annuus]